MLMTNADELVIFGTMEGPQRKFESLRHTPCDGKLPGPP